MRFVYLPFVIAAGLLSKHTLQYPSGRERDASHPEQPKKHLRLFGQNIVAREPSFAAPTGSSPLARPVNDFQYDPRIWQGTPFHHLGQVLPPINHPQQGHNPSGIDHPYWEQSPSSLRYSHYGQGASSSLPPVQGPLAAIEQLSSSSSSHSSPDRAPGSSNFMRDARNAVQQRSQHQQEMVTKPFGARNLAQTRKSKKQEQEVKYEKSGIRANHNELELIEADIHGWKGSKGNRERTQSFLSASSGQYGTVRLGMKEPTDQGQIRAPLPSPMWPMAWRSVFNREMTHQLKTKLLKEGQDLKQFDAELGAEKNGALQIAQKAQTKWWTTTPEYRGGDRNKKLRQLFEVNKQAKELFPWKYTKEVMLYPVEAAQQGTPRVPDITLIISNRFIPPDNTGAIVYRTLPGDKEG